MVLSNTQRENISLEVIKTLVSRFDSFPEDASGNRNAPFHEAFLKAFSDRLCGKVSDTPFFISLSSWLQGLNTTLGQTFFEKVAHHLCDGEKREYTSKRLGIQQITQSQKSHISRIMTDLSNSTSKPSLVDENKLLFLDDQSSLVDAMGFSADVFVEDDDSITAIELKSVKPNSGEMRGEKQKILEGKAALWRLYHPKQINFYIGFPFDPTVDPSQESVTSYNKERFLDSIINMTKFFAPSETLVASELWDKLSGQPNTMDEILEVINLISTTKFQEKFQLLLDGSKRLTAEYREQLVEWNLCSEIELIDNDSSIKSRIRSDSGLSKKYNHQIFDGKGNYNHERYHALMS